MYKNFVCKHKFLSSNMISRLMPILKTAVKFVVIDFFKTKPIDTFFFKFVFKKILFNLIYSYLV